MNYSALKKHILKRLRNELPDNLFYHGIHHTINVKDSVIEIAKSEDITDHDLTILKTAALCHDFGFVSQYHNNENIASTMATKVLVDFEYSQEETEQVSALIQATSLPQTPTNYLEKILCDADLFYLGTDEFPQISESLRKELSCQGKTFSDHEWYSYQMSFLKKHHFFTEYAQKNLIETKQKNTEFIQTRLDNYKQ